MKKFPVIALSLALAGSMSLSARADNLTPGTWDAFYFGDAGSQATSEATGDVDFFADGPIYINVTDGYEPGDEFTVYDNGSLLGTTDAVSNTSDAYCTDPNVCFANANFSHGTWLVGAGVNDITIYTAVSPFGGGGAWVESSTTVPGPSPVPEPGSIGLLGSGLLGLAGVLRRKLAR